MKAFIFRLPSNTIYIIYIICIICMLQLILKINIQSYFKDFFIFNFPLPPFPHLWKRTVDKSWIAVLYSLFWFMHRFLTPVRKKNFGKTQINVYLRQLYTTFRKAGKFSHICKVINHMKEAIYPALMLKKKNAAQILRPAHRPRQSRFSEDQLPDWTGCTGQGRLAVCRR